MVANICVCSVAVALTHSIREHASGAREYLQQRAAEELRQAAELDEETSGKELLMCVSLGVFRLRLFVHQRGFSRRFLHAMRSIPFETPIGTKPQGSMMIHRLNDCVYSE